MFANLYWICHQKKLTDTNFVCFFFYFSHLLLVVNSSTNMILYIFLNKLFRLHFINHVKSIVGCLLRPCAKAVRYWLYPKGLLGISINDVMSILKVPFFPSNRFLVALFRSRSYWPYKPNLYLRQITLA